MEKVTTQLEVVLRAHLLCVYAGTIPHDSCLNIFQITKAVRHKIGLGISVSLDQRQDAEQTQDLKEWHDEPYKHLPTGTRRSSLRSPLQMLTIQIRNKNKNGAF